MPAAGLSAAGAIVFVGPPLSASMPSFGLANVDPLAHGGISFMQTMWFFGHCTSACPWLFPSCQVIGAPQSIDVLFAKTVLSIVSAVPPAIAAAKRPEPASEWLSANVQFLIVPPLPKRLI